MLKLENQEYKGLTCSLYYEVKRAVASKAHNLPNGDKACDFTVAYEVYTSIDKEHMLAERMNSHTFNIPQEVLSQATDVYALAYIKLKELDKFSEAIDC